MEQGQWEKEEGKRSWKLEKKGNVSAVALLMFFNTYPIYFLNHEYVSFHALFVWVFLVMGFLLPEFEVRNICIFLFLFLWSAFFGIFLCNSFTVFFFFNYFVVCL